MKSSKDLRIVILETASGKDKPSIATNTIPGEDETLPESFQEQVEVNLIVSLWPAQVNNCLLKQQPGSRKPGKIFQNREAQHPRLN